MVIIMRFINSFASTSLTRTSSLSARSFTVMPSASVIVRVIGGGAAGAGSGAGADGRSRRGLHRTRWPGRCWPNGGRGCRMAGARPGMPGPRLRRAGCVRTGCDGSGRGPPSMPGVVGRGGADTPDAARRRAGSRTGARGRRAGGVAGLRRRGGAARRLHHARLRDGRTLCRRQRPRRLCGVCRLFDAQPNRRRHEPAGAVSGVRLRGGGCSTRQAAPRRRRRLCEPATGAAAPRRRRRRLDGAGGSAAGGGFGDGRPAGSGAAASRRASAPRRRRVFDRQRRCRRGGAPA